MGAKLTRMHPKMRAVLEWAEHHPAVITEQVEQASSEPGLNLTGLSNLLYEILMERTGSRAALR